MFTNKAVTRSIAVACALSLSMTALGSGTLGVATANAQSYGPPGYAPPGYGQPSYGQPNYGQPYYSQAQIDQLVAPIALYPDPLLAQMLTAAAYPNELAQAYQFVSR